MRQFNLIRGRMWLVLSFVLLTLLEYTGGHVALIYPPARKYNWDFMDNIRTPGPCGVPSGLGPKTTLLAGSTITVSFHLAYPHRGGYFLEVMNNETNSIHRHPTSGFLSTTDTTSRSTSFVLPSQACNDCTVRLVRQAAEWGGSCGRLYLFWSCADVDIVQGQFVESCSGHGTWSNNQCNCDQFYMGDRCQHEVECKNSADCTNHGSCIDVASAPNPIKHCYCQHGWYGEHCELVSSVSSPAIDYNQYKERSMSDDYTLYYRYLPTSSEIEMVLKVKTLSWAAIGWRPAYLRSGCQLFPNLPGMPQWDIGNPTIPGGSGATPSGEPHPEVTSEPHPEVTSEPHPEVSGEPETTSEPEATSEPEVTSEPETTSEPEASSEPEVTSEPETTSEPEVTSEPETTGEPESTSEPETTSEPEATSEPETTSEPEATSEPETTSEPEPENTPCSASWSQGCTSDGCNYKASWEFNNDTDVITFNLEAKLGGADKWIGIGFSNDQTMPSSDAIVGWVKNGQATAKDVWINSRTTPVTDDTQSITGVSGSIVNGLTKLTFSRVRNTGDSADLQFSDTDCYYFFYAVGGGYNAASGTIYKHANTPIISTSKICIKSCTAAEPEPEGISEPVPESTSEPEPENTGSCPTGPTPEPGYSNGGGITGTSDTLGNGLHGMDCTDIILGSARGDLSRIGDYYTRGRSTPRRDVIYGGEESLTAALGFEENGTTVIMFRRKVQATHRSDHNIEKAIMHVIWAQGQHDVNYIHRPSSGDKPGFYARDQLLYHGHAPQRGVQSINFLEDAKDLTTTCNGYWPLSCPASGCPLEVTWVLNVATDVITFTLKAKNLGNKWIGVGFSKDQNMPNSDAVVGWVDNGIVTVTDRWMTAKSTPAIDDTENILNPTGIVKDGTTTITFQRKRKTGDDSDFQFSDTECAYMFYAMGGSYNVGDKSITQHTNVPSISAGKVCIRACDFKTKVTTGGVTLKSEVEVKILGTFDEKLDDHETAEYAKLAEAMSKWLDDSLKISVTGYLRNYIVGFSNGSIIVNADVFVEKGDDSEQTLQEVKSDINNALLSAVANPPQGYTFDTTHVKVSDPSRVVKPTSFRLSLIEEIVIGLAVALVIVCIVVAVCKFSEAQKMKQKKFDNHGSYPGSSTTSLTDTKSSKTHTITSYEEFMNTKQPV